jgi:hypothetical protein
VRKQIAADEANSPTVTSKVSKISKMTMGIGERKPEKKEYTFKEA